MNILFVLYGGIETNSFLCLARFAKELHLRGYGCAVVPLIGKIKPWEEPYLKVLTMRQALKNPQACFENQKKADVIHAWTPRQNVVDFVLKYQMLHPAPLFVFSEDDEGWLAQEWMKLPVQGICEKIKTIFCTKKIPPYLSDPVQMQNFLKSADVVAIITPELQKKLPPGLNVDILIPGVELKEFFPRPAASSFRKKYHLDSAQKLIIYCGGVSPFTGPSIKDLCQMVTLLNKRGYPTTLVRSGVRSLSSITGIKQEDLKYVLDLGLLSREEIPELISLADVFVQPGRPSPFEEGRLPCKIIEFMAMGVPTILPNCNIGLIIEECKEAMIHKSGTPDEMANLCQEVFNNPSLQINLKVGARRFAEKYFDIQKNTDQLEKLYKRAQKQFLENTLLNCPK